MATTKQIKATLRDLGIRPNVNGYEYLTDAICIIVDDPGTKITALYAHLARRRDTTPAGVERSMRHAIHRGMDTGDPTLYAALRLHLRARRLHHSQPLRTHSCRLL